MRVKIPEMIRQLEMRWRSRYKPALVRGFIHTMRRFETDLVTQRMSGRPGLNRRTGRSARSWSFSILGKSRSITAIMRSPEGHLRVHEYSGRIYPKKGRYLWIPGPSLQTAAGVFRGAGNSSAVWGAVNWDAVFYRRSSGGNLVALEQIGAGGVRLVATLVDSVFIPARLGLRDLWRETVPDRIRDLNAALIAAR